MAVPPQDPAESIRPPWRQVAVEFVSARLELIALEARDATRQVGRKILLAIVACLAAAFTWLLALIGVIGWLAGIQSALSWPVLTLLAALAHLGLAILSIHLLRRPASPPFPLSRQELTKDREWLSQLHPHEKP